MALCVPKVMILGHSFVKRLQKDLENLFDDRTKPNFNMEEVKVRLFGVGGRTVEKIRKYDLKNVVRRTYNLVKKYSFTETTPSHLQKCLDQCANHVMAKGQVFSEGSLAG